MPERNRAVLAETRPVSETSTRPQMPRRE
jgi:hypothetical protein